MRSLWLPLCAVLLVGVPGTADAQGRGRAGGGPPPTGRAAAPKDLTGTWVSVVTEHWHLRMLVPPKGEFAMLPLNPEARKLADGVGSGEGAGGRGSAGPTARRPSCACRAFPHPVGGRQHAADGHRLGHADAHAAVRCDAAGESAARVAGLLGRELGGPGRARPRRHAHAAQGQDDPDAAGILAQERRALQRERHARGVRTIDSPSRTATTGWW